MKQHYPFFYYFVLNNHALLEIHEINDMMKYNSVIRGQVTISFTLFKNFFLNVPKILPLKICLIYDCNLWPSPYPTKVLGIRTTASAGEL